MMLVLPRLRLLLQLLELPPLLLQSTRLQLPQELLLLRRHVFPSRGEAELAAPTGNGAAENKKQKGGARSQRA